MFWHVLLQNVHAPIIFFYESLTIKRVQNNLENYFNTDLISLHTVYLVVSAPPAGAPRSLKFSEATQ